MKGRDSDNSHRIPARSRRSSLTEYQRGSPGACGCGGGSRLWCSDLDEGCSRAQFAGIRHCIVQWTPVFRKLISVLPSNARSADCNSLVPKPSAPTFSIEGPSVSSQVRLRRSSDTDHDTCNSPRGEENAPYFPALVANS